MVKSSARMAKPSTASSATNNNNQHHMGAEKFYTGPNPNPTSNFISSPPKLEPLVRTNRGSINLPLQHFHDMYSSTSRVNSTVSQVRPPCPGPGLHPLALTPFAAPPPPPTTGNARRPTGSRAPRYGA